MSKVPRLSIRPAADTKRPAAHKGKSAEALVSAWLEARQASSSGFAYHRLPDAKAARGALAAQPADFIISTHRGGMAFLEVKESGERYRLPKANISQYGKLLAFHLAGTPSWVLVRRTLTSDWLIFSSHGIMGQDNRDLKSFPWAMGWVHPDLDSAMVGLLGD